jgi:hypothetical protein
VDPIDINVAGSNNDVPTTNMTVTLKITGFGNTSIQESTIPFDIVFAIDSSSSMAENDPNNLKLQNHF